MINKPQVIGIQSLFVVKREKFQKVFQEAQQPIFIFSSCVCFESEICINKIGAFAIEIKTCDNFRSKSSLTEDKRSLYLIQTKVVAFSIHCAASFNELIKKLYSILKTPA